MTERETERVNGYLVRVFNQILSWEEQSFRDMGISEITLRELHVVEAVYSLLEEEKNCMSEIAKYLSITPGSLTTAVNCLVKKGYLERKASPSDRRVVMIFPTKSAEKVNEMHIKLHKDMISEAFKDVDSKNMDAIIEILVGLEKFFDAKNNLRK